MTLHKDSAGNICSDDRTLEYEAESGLFEELLGYLQAISNPVRLEIILFIEKRPRSVREIAKHTNTNYDNAKKHIEKLMKTGIIKKEAGIGEETSKGSLPVWKYSVIPGGIESVIRNLNSFSNLDLRIISDKANEAVCMFCEKYSVKEEEFSYLAVLGGDDDGKIFHLKSLETRIGRASVSVDYEENSGFIGLCRTYLSVTRIDGPHAAIKREGTECFFVDLGSTNGSYINHRAVLKGESVLLSDGDKIDLGKGSTRARLIFYKSNKMPVV